MAKYEIPTELKEKLREVIRETKIDIAKVQEVHMEIQSLIIQNLFTPLERLVLIAQLQEANLLFSMESFKGFKDD